MHKDPLGRTETLVRTRSVETLFGEMERMQQRIRRRAYEIFQSRGAGIGRAFDDWLSAEHELLWKPPIELAEHDGEFELDVALPGIEPKDLEVRVTSEDLLVRGSTGHAHAEEQEKVHVCELECGEVFRTVHFPKRVDPEHVKADYRRGLLHVTAAIAKDQSGRKVDIATA